MFELMLKVKDQETQKASQGKFSALLFEFIVSSYYLCTHEVHEAGQEAGYSRTLFQWNTKHMVILIITNNEKDEKCVHLSH